MPEQINFLLDNIPNLLIGFPGHRPGGLLMSIVLAAVAIGLGLLLAIFIAAGHESRRRPVRVAARVYVQVFRGIPLILLLLIVHQLLRNGRFVGLSSSPLLSALVTLTLYSSAYQAQIVQAGLSSVPQRMVEAARLMGSNQRQAYLTIKLRYTLHVMLPAFTGQAISVFKDTSVVVILGVAELMTVARIALGGDVGNAPFWMGLYLVVGLFYFLVAFTLSRLARSWESAHRIRDLTHSLVSY